MFVVSGVFDRLLFSAIHESLVVVSLISATNELEPTNYRYKFDQEHETDSIVAVYKYFKQ